VQFITTCDERGARQCQPPIGHKARIGYRLPSGTQPRQADEPKSKKVSALPNAGVN
jgi:hypothetical protein